MNPATLRTVNKEVSFINLTSFYFNRGVRSVIFQVIAGYTELSRVGVHGKNLSVIENRGCATGMKKGGQIPLFYSVTVLVSWNS